MKMRLRCSSVVTREKFFTSLPLRERWVKGTSGVFRLIWFSDKELFVAQMWNHIPKVGGASYDITIVPVDLQAVLTR